MRTLAYFSLLIGLVLGTSDRTLAQEITFKASVDRTSIAAGEQLKLTIALSNTQERFGAPDLGGLVIVQGPFESSNMSIFNGRMSSTITRTWVLTAAQPGRYTIGPAKVKVGGGYIQTDPITIEVTKGAATRPSDPNATLGQQRDPNLFTTISLSKSKGYVGEQVVATYMLYSRYNNLQSVSKELPKISNAWTEEVDLGELHWEEKMQTINGLPYRVAVLRKQVLFPQRSGKLRIEPFEQTCVIDRSFFNQGRTVEVRSNAVEYTVLDLPSGAPADFSGAVGELQMTVTASRTRLQENESVDLTVRFSGRTNLKLLEAPAIALPNDIETFEPKVTDRITVNGNGMSGSREYQFLLIPRHEGNYELPPVTVSYFDTQIGDYKTLSSGPTMIEVLPGDGSATTTLPQRPAQSDIQLLEKDIRHIRTGDLELEPVGHELFASPAWIAGMTAPAIAFMLLLAWRRKQAREAQDIAGSRRKAADRTARRHLKLAEQALQSNDREVFYSALSKALGGYMADKFGTGITTNASETIRRRLADAPDSEQLATNYQRLITACDMARFAPVEEVPRATLFNEAAALIGTIEQRTRS
ncbi:MAG: BatD family protein [Flavobacteriales bacterium]|jgi:hypothetical protein